MIVVVVVQIICFVNKFKTRTHAITHTTTTTTTSFETLITDAIDNNNN